MPNKQRPPRLQCWYLATVTAALRLFQGLSAVTCLCLVCAVKAQFVASYGVCCIALITAFISPTLVAVYSFNVPIASPNINWILYELLYLFSSSFLWLVSTFILAYSSYRWEHNAWWLATVLAIFTFIASLVDLVRVCSLFSKDPTVRHSIEPFLDDRQ